MKLIFEKRKELGLTREELGKRAGCSAQHIYNWEKTDAPVPIKRVKALAKALNLPAKTLLKALIAAKTQKMLVDL